MSNNDNSLEANKSIYASLFIHLLGGIILLSIMFSIQAIANGIELSPQKFLVPNIVGIVSGLLIWKSKATLIRNNADLEKIVEQKTLDLKMANEMLSEMVKKSSDKSA